MPENGDLEEVSPMEECEVCAGDCGQAVGTVSFDFPGVRMSVRFGQGCVDAVVRMMARQWNEAVARQNEVTNAWSAMLGLNFSAGGAVMGEGRCPKCGSRACVTYGNECDEFSAGMPPMDECPNCGENHDRAEHRRLEEAGAFDPSHLRGVIRDVLDGIVGSDHEDADVGLAAVHVEALRAALTGRNEPPAGGAT